MLPAYLREKQKALLFQQLPQKSVKSAVIKVRYKVKWVIFTLSNPVLMLLTKIHLHKCATDSSLASPLSPLFSIENLHDVDELDDIPLDNEAKNFNQVRSLSKVFITNSGHVCNQYKKCENLQCPSPWTLNTLITGFIVFNSTNILSLVIARNSGDQNVWPIFVQNGVKIAIRLTSIRLSKWLSKQ